MVGILFMAYRLQPEMRFAYIRTVDDDDAAIADN